MHLTHYTCKLIFSLNIFLLSSSNFIRLYLRWVQFIVLPLPSLSLSNPTSWIFLHKFIFICMNGFQKFGVSTFARFRFWNQWFGGWAIIQLPLCTRRRFILASTLKSNFRATLSNSLEDYLQVGPPKLSPLSPPMATIPVNPKPFLNNQTGKTLFVKLKWEWNTKVSLTRWIPYVRLPPDFVSSTQWQTKLESSKVVLD